MRIALLQLNVSDNPAANLSDTLDLVRRAHAGGARFILTPECTNGLSSSRAHQREVFRHEAGDLTLAELREEAASLKQAGYALAFTDDV